MSDGDLAIDHIQELRGYVMRGSPVLLSPEAAKHVLSIIERDGLTVPRWVPLWERLPADGEECVASMNNWISGKREQLVTFQIGGVWYSDMRDDNEQLVPMDKTYASMITHWFQMPPVPSI